MEIPILLTSALDVRLQAILGRPCNVGHSQFVLPCGQRTGPSCALSGISVAFNTKSSPVYISLSVFPGFNGQWRDISFISYDERCFSICPFPERDRMENEGFGFFVCVCVTGWILEREAQ